jgi:DNA-binding transcriptional LysR family regulator
MDLDLRCAASFLVLAETGHFGRAAAQLHVTAAALTKRIQRLERQVGVPLLIRDTAGVAGLTAAGRRFALEAGALLAAAHVARAAARGEAPPAIRLGVVGAVGEFPRRQLLTEVGRQFHLLHPDVKLTYIPVPISSVHSCLLEGVVDVMWGTAPDPSLAVQTRPLVELERFAVVPAHHPLADAVQVDAVDFAELPIAFDASVPADWAAPMILADFRPVREARLSPIRATTARGVFAQVARGTCVTTTAWLASELGPRLRAIRLAGLPPAAFHAACRRSDRREPVRTLLDILPRVAATGTRAPNTRSPASPTCW